MKKKFNKDDSIDLVFTQREFMGSPYIVGVVHKCTEKNIYVRIRGLVPDVKYLVFLKKVLNAQK